MLLLRSFLKRRLSETWTKWVHHSTLHWFTNLNLDVFIACYLGLLLETLVLRSLPWSRAGLRSCISRIKLTHSWDAFAMLLADISLELVHENFRVLAFGVCLRFMKKFQTNWPHIWEEKLSGKKYFLLNFLEVFSLRQFLNKYTKFKIVLLSLPTLELYFAV